MDVTIPEGDGAPATPAFAILPPNATRGIVIVHELYGRRPEIDRVVERFAAKGYAAVAPDLFHRGRVTCLFDYFRAAKTGEGILITQGRNARAWLCEESGVVPSRVGLIGFCFGGGYALAAGSGWAAVSTNYGPVPERAAMRGIGPVIGLYGSRDLWFGRTCAAQLRERLDDPEVHVFDAGHSFLTDARPGFMAKLTLGMAIDDYPEAREEGWRHIFSFFDRHLGPP